MNFKQWLILSESIHDPFKEAESNQLTQKLCDWIKTHNRNPSKKTSMLGGTHTTSGEISYNIDPEEVMLADFLQSRKTAKIININYFPTDEDILDKNNMSGLFDSKISNRELARELASNQKVRGLAIRYKELGTDPDWNTPLGSFLSKKRRAYQDYKRADGTKTTTNIWYPSDIEIAKENGLPDDWMDSQIEKVKSKNEQKSNNQVIELAIIYKQLGKYPPAFKQFLNKKRRAYNAYVNGIQSNYIWYPSDITVAQENGLPDNWMDSQIETVKSKNEQKSNNQVIELAKEFKKLGTGEYPPEFKSFLDGRRKAYTHLINGTKNSSFPWYPSDIAIAKENGLPDDWMELQSELKSNKQIRELAIKYKELGFYPPEFNKFLNRRRIAYQDYINGTKRERYAWYPSDIAIAKENGLPDDWMLFRSSKFNN